MNKGAAPLIVGIIVLIGLLVGVNLWSNRSIGGSSDDQSQQQQQQQQQSDQSSKTSTDPADKPVANLTGDLVTSLVPEQTIGNPATAKTKVTIGYTFDTATQTHPEKAAQIVDAVRSWAQKPGSNASVTIVCLDLPTDQLTNPADAKVPLGIAINGKQPAGFNANPGEGAYTSQSVLKALGVS